MSDYFMGQVMMTGFPFAQKNFAGCNGALLPIQQNSALFSLLGTVYGGDGVRTFMLPDLRGRSPIGGFSSYDPGWQPPTLPIGVVGGVETVALTPDQNGPHTHGFAATQEDGTSPYIEGNMLLAQATGGVTIYGAAANLIPLGGGGSSIAGASAPHANMQPYAVINFNIAMYGIYPSRT
ncbi:tail fiber protein [Sphingomonas sp. PB2P19]|uniref:phage tail protein n=1 Tax=Sphingomonas rhamnosi TaxID=3096156 RepID=UPI002FC96012